MWRITAEQAASLLKEGGGKLIPGLEFIDPKDKFTESTGFTFDVSYGAPEPDAPAQLRQHKIEGYQYWTVVFAGPHVPYYKILPELGIEDIGSFQPNGRRIWATDKQIEQLEAMVSENSIIQWTGPLHPYYRLLGLLNPTTPNHVDLSSRQLVKIHLTLHRHANVGEAVAKLQTLYYYLKVHATYLANNVFIQLEIPASEIITIAKFPDFKSMEMLGESYIFERPGCFD